MPELKNVKEYIRALEHITSFMRSILDEEKRVTAAPATDDEKLSELTDLRMMTKSNIWPDAISADLIGGEEDKDRIDRADGILVDFIKMDLTDKRFLDFGCGDGWVAQRAYEHGAAFSIGYDTEDHNWSKHTPVNARFGLTTNLTDNEFDVILLNDVLDHADDPVEVLKKVLIAKKTDAKVFVRCHPFPSRHATHLYRKINKAYLHLVFSHQELIAMGLKGEKTAKLLDPIASYKRWFEMAGLSVVEESTIKQDVDAFFTTRPAIVRRIKENWTTSSDPELAAGTKFPHEAMEIQFADFVLV
jgi:2-polyprenyl-3-methyl-5-hydroxy-6-metoxy-1,4-benzoquinol methylase